MHNMWGFLPHRYVIIAASKVCPPHCAFHRFSNVSTWCLSKRREGEERVLLFPRPKKVLEKLRGRLAPGRRSPQSLCLCGLFFLNHWMTKMFSFFGFPQFIPGEILVVSGLPGARGGHSRTRLAPQCDSLTLSSRSGC